MPSLDENAERRKRIIIEGLRGRRLDQAVTDPEFWDAFQAEAASNDPRKLVSDDLFKLGEQAREVRKNGPPLGLFFSTDDVILVPGFLGSELDDSGSGGGVIWVDPLLAVGRTGRLSNLRLAPFDKEKPDANADANPASNIQPNGSVPVIYSGLRYDLEFRRYSVLVFGFDWRKSVDASAVLLAGLIQERATRPFRPLHLIAHSQGTIVTRRALQLLGVDLGRKLVNNVVLLGPATAGTFSAAFALAGDNSLIETVGRFGIKPPDDFTSVLQSMTGLYQLLPWRTDPVDGQPRDKCLEWVKDNREKFGKAEHWKNECGLSDNDGERLTKFYGWANEIDATYLNDRTTIILGDRPTTGGVEFVDGKVVSVFDVLGDGTVPDSLAKVMGVTRVFKAKETEHMMLPASLAVIAAVRDVLAGRSPRIAQTLGLSGTGVPFLIEPQGAPELPRPVPVRAVAATEKPVKTEQPDGGKGEPPPGGAATPSTTPPKEKGGRQALPEGMPSGAPAPPTRKLRVFSFDPLFATELDAKGTEIVTVELPWDLPDGDRLEPGPVGEYVEVVDYDPASGCFYPPVDLNHPHLLAQNGLPPAEGDPRFHQQMAYAVSMTTIRRFETALGRAALWAPNLKRDSVTHEVGWASWPKTPVLVPQWTTPVANVAALPTPAPNQVVVAKLGAVLHFRVCDDKGEILVDVDETSLPRKTEEIADLKGLLQTLKTEEIADLKILLQTLPTPSPNTLPITKGEGVLDGSVPLDQESSSPPPPKEGNAELLKARVLSAVRTIVDPTRPEDQYVQRLRIYPHGLREANAYYHPDKKALLLGYFPAVGADVGRNLPGGMIFASLSYDIIAHETTHALLDGLHRYFTEPSNADVFAFHEAFADVVAMFQHFTHPEVLRHQIDESRGDLRKKNMLGVLAAQFGEATGHRAALRQYLGRWNEKTKRWEPVSPDPAKIREVWEPHERGAILVAALFHAFADIYENRVRDLRRIATGGTGILPNGDLHPDLVNRMADEAAKAARHMLNMCIRALDYIPPVDITFGEYLRALITADYDLVRDDDLGYRVSVVSAFRAWGIYPADVRSLSVDSLLWSPPEVAAFQHAIDFFRPGAHGEPHPGDADLPKKPCVCERVDDWNLRSDRLKAFVDMDEYSQRFHKWLEDNVTQGRDRYLGLYLLSDADYEAQEAERARQRSNDPPANPYKSIRRKKDKDGRSVPVFEVHSLRPCRRIGPDGQQRADVVVEIVQRRKGFLDKSTQKNVDFGKIPYDDPRVKKPDFYFRGGCTLIIDPDTGDVRICVRKSICHDKRLEKERQFRLGQFGDKVGGVYLGGDVSDGNPFAFLHVGQ